jgi:hypothetical protein
MTLFCQTKALIRNYLLSTLTAKEKQVNREKLRRRRR